MLIRSTHPVQIAHVEGDLPEVMHYLYLPVLMLESSADIRMPHNIAHWSPLVRIAMDAALRYGRQYDYAYISARKGRATPDNPLNRPGWHGDGFGTEDLNFVWWRGPGTRFAVQDFDVDDDHVTSLRQFEEQVRPECIVSPPEGSLYMLTPSIIHATPIIGAPGCMRQYVKISLSNDRYNLENNSHNYLFDYHWPLHSRELIRNDPHRAQADSVVPA